jgi:DNA-binding NarL/FixJ family response regulator
MKKHAILIVEDDEKLSDNYKIFCQMAISGLQRDGLNIEIEVVQAFTIEDAIKNFDSYLIDFMSLDLALKKNEGHLRDSDRKQGREAGGMAFLKSLREKNNRTNVIIVSGETLMSYSIDALQKYGVLGFYQKAELDAKDYINAVQAALWYQSALEVISNLENFETDPDDIKRAEKYWENALEAATAANINPNSFANPEARIVSIRSKLDKETGIPSNEWVEKVLIRNILHHSEWSLFQVEITNLSAFENAHASQVAPLSFYIASQLKEISPKFNFEDVFIGKYHFGHREALILISGRKVNKS